jgi:hypothetical protein
MRFSVTLKFIFSHAMSFSTDSTAAVMSLKWPQLRHTLVEMSPANPFLGGGKEKKQLKYRVANNIYLQITHGWLNENTTAS